MEFFQNNLEIILAFPASFGYNVSAWALCAYDITNHTPGDRAPLCLAKGGQRGMIGVEDKNKRRFLKWLSYL